VGEFEGGGVMVWDFPFDTPMYRTQSPEDSLKWIRREVERLNREEKGMSDPTKEGWVPCNDPRHVKHVGHVCNFDLTKEGSAAREREIMEYERGKGMSDSSTPPEWERVGRLDLKRLSVDVMMEKPQSTPNSIVLASGPAAMNIYLIFRLEECGEQHLTKREARLLARFILEMVGSE